MINKNTIKILKKIFKFFFKFFYTWLILPRKHTMVID